MLNSGQSVRKRSNVRGGRRKGGNRRNRKGGKRRSSSDASRWDEGRRYFCISLSLYIVLGYFIL